jgi:hypothetical protein
VGGLIGRIKGDGQNEVTVADIEFNGTVGSEVNFAQFVGGLVGEVESGSLSLDDFRVDVSVTAKDEVGGVIGTGSEATLNNGVVNMAVVGTGEHAGGVIGATPAILGAVSINATRVNGSVNGNDFVGGFAGAVRGSVRLEITNSTGNFTEALVDSSADKTVPS